MKKSLLLISAFSALMLSGCGSLTGFSNAQTDFSCADLTGKPSCRNISDIYSQTKEESDGAAQTNFISSQVSQSNPLGSFFGSDQNKNSSGAADKNLSPEEALLREEQEAAASESSVANADFAVISPASPWRKPETIFRVWMAPFTDTQGDLHDQRYMYVKVLNAGWSVPTIDELAKPRSPYRPVHPLSQDKASEPAPKKPNPLNVLQGKAS